MKVKLTYIKTVHVDIPDSELGPDGTFPFHIVRRYLPFGAIAKSWSIVRSNLHDVNHCEGNYKENEE
jgi:hypothetical protein